MEPPWAKVAVNFYRHPRTRRLSKDAQHLLLASILHCVEFGTDGRFPADETPLLASVSRVRSSLSDELFAKGSWVEDGDEVVVRDFLQWQTPAEVVRGKSDRAKKAADARWAKERGDPDAPSNTERNAERNAASNAECNASREEESREEKPPDRFDDFWSVYPRLVGKRAAQSAWKNAVKRKDPDAIIEGALNFARNMRDHGTDSGFIAHPTTWLNRDGWDDELVSPSKTDGGSSYR